MRIARSTSPRRRKRLPSAKWSSIVWGSTFTTSMKASIALSGCSFSRKLRPLKYDRGNARDSSSSCLMSTRAANQPRAKNSGSASSHQYSISMRASARPGRARRDVGPGGGRAGLALQGRDLPAQLQELREARDDAQDDAGEKGDGQHEKQRRLP